MSSNTSLSDAGSRSPLLGSGGHEGEAKARWWKRILDVEAAKNQVLFSLPITITNLSYYLIPLVSVMFAGHLGELQLAGSNLAHSWSTVTGLTLMIFYCPYYEVCSAHLGRPTSEGLPREAYL
ncbi:hypothetical protein F0562_010344 [Nyssa sinensis]|uniref:Protein DETOXIFICATION n=1 Tax=Nyssa sinensis TaxID=561372 RepID=A0A5J5A3D6_9ASTE|nr:hypothetical protein F0562_010344 [Nyssa sinensis]